MWGQNQNWQKLTLGFSLTWQNKSRLCPRAPVAFLEHSNRRFVTTSNHMPPHYSLWEGWGGDMFQKQANEVICSKTCLFPFGWYFSADVIYPSLLIKWKQVTITCCAIREPEIKPSNVPLKLVFILNWVYEWTWKFAMPAGYSSWKMYVAYRVLLTIWISTLFCSFTYS